MLPCSNNNGDWIASGCGGSHSIGLKAGSTIHCPGLNYECQCNPPDILNRDLVMVDGGEENVFVMRDDGFIFGWGRNDDGPQDPLSVPTRFSSCQKGMGFICFSDLGSFRAPVFTGTS